MKVYVNRVQHASLPDFIWKRETKYLLRLVGINTSSDKRNRVIEPIYCPVLNITPSGKMTFIEVGWNSPFLLVVLSPWRPFIHMERTDVVQVGDE
jgi:hypothetical protein